MEEKYRKLNEMFREKTKHLILWKKQQNRKFITDFREIQEILWKSTENKTLRDRWGNTNAV